ncbi:MAG: hypothetical protein KC766_24475 [Myxococcales bacterium]|nr:hypothetical protein [Myxococcales bacterium]
MIPRPLDPWRQGRALTIGACYLAGALGTVCYGEIAATRPAPTEEVEVDVAGAPDSEAKPGVGRVKQDAFLVPPPDAPAGSITRNLFESPLPNGVTLTQIGAREGGNTDTDGVAPVADPASAGEPAAVLADRTVVYDLKAFGRKAGEYVVAVRGRCNKPPGAPSCRLRLALNGSDLTVMSFSDSVSLQSRVIQSARLNPQGNGLGLLSMGDSSLELTHLSLMPLGPSLDLNVGTPSARPYLVAGFYDDESDGNRRAAWSSGERSVIALPIAPRPDRAYVVRITAHAVEALAPLTVEARLNGKPLGSEKFGAGWGYHSYPVPRGSLQSGANLLELSYPTTVQPAEVEPGSEDHRALAVRIEKVWVTPSDGPADQPR